jgi:hypothetical protein
MSLPDRLQVEVERDQLKAELLVSIISTLII